MDHSLTLNEFFALVIWEKKMRRAISDEIRRCDRAAVARFSARDLADRICNRRKIADDGERRSIESLARDIMVQRYGRAS